MMKKNILLVALFVMLSNLSLKAQTNLQEMYDFGRGHFTTTLEISQKDDWGSTYAYTDIYHIDANRPTAFYTEIARSLNFWNETPVKDLSFHVEWNGGQYANNAWLVGVEYTLHNLDYSNTFTFQVLYKNIRYGDTLYAFDKPNDVPLQLSFVWGMHDLFNFTGLTFCGFLDFWWENNIWSNPGEPIDKTPYTLLLEPQVWYNVGQFFGCDNLHVGGELELAYNYANSSREQLHARKGFLMAPCFGIKWIF